MATLTLLPDTGHQQQQPLPHGHHHVKQKCTSATCCSPSRIWRSIQQLIGDNNKQDLIKLCQDPNRASHVLRVLLSSRLTNDASLYPASNKHRVIQLVDRDGASGLSPLHYRAMVNVTFGKTATDLNALQLALFHGNEGIACYLLQLVRQYAGDKETALFVNHLWGTRNGSLHLACFLGMPRVVQLLLEMGVSPDAVNGKLKSPLDCCVGVNGGGMAEGGQPSVLDCRTLIEHALLIKYGKKLSVDASSPSLGVGVVITPPTNVTAAASEQKSSGDDNVVVSPALMDVDDDKCVVNSNDLVQVDDGGIKPSLGGNVQDSSPNVSPLSGGGMNDNPDIHDQAWSLPLLLTDSPFASGDPFASDDDNDEEWSPPLLLMVNPFASGDPFISDDDVEEEWSPPLLLKDTLFASDDPFASDDDDDIWTVPMLLLMDNPFASDDPFVSADDDFGAPTCSMDGDGLVQVPLVMDSDGKCSVNSNLQASDGGVSSSISGDYYDDNPSGGDKSSPNCSFLVDSGDGFPVTSVATSPLGHSHLLFGLKHAPDPKPQDSSYHQVLDCDSRMATRATRVRGRIRSLDPTTSTVENDADTSWSQLQYPGSETGDPRTMYLLYSFVKQFKANLKSYDWKALRHESPLAEPKIPANELMKMLTGIVHDGINDQDNPNTERLLLMITRALHTLTTPTSTTPLYQCNFTGWIDNNHSLESQYMVHHCSSLSLLMVGGNT